MQRITPCLWFNGNAGEAMDYYTSIFDDAKVLSTSSNEGKVGFGCTLSSAPSWHYFTGCIYLLVNLLCN